MKETLSSHKPFINHVHTTLNRKWLIKSLHSNLLLSANIQVQVWVLVWRRLKQMHTWSAFVWVFFICGLVLKCGRISVGYGKAWAYSADCGTCTVAVYGLLSVRKFQFRSLVQDVHRHLCGRVWTHHGFIEQMNLRVQRFQVNLQCV
jgi:hypothetical protein